MKSYLVTGGFGFFGGRLALYLSEKGHRVVLGSRHQRQSPSWLIDGEVRKINWNAPDSLATACAGIDIVVHAAGMDAADCLKDPNAAMEFNGEVTGSFARAAELNGVCQFVFLSTAHVYSSCLSGEITEQTETLNDHPYAASNLFGERKVLNGSEKSTMGRSVFRLSNGFGVPAGPGTNCGKLVINDLCQQAVTMRKMILKTSGIQRRDFIAMSDAVEAIERFTDFSPQSGIYNLGGSWTPNIREVAELVQARCLMKLGFKPEIKYSESNSLEIPAKLSYRTEALAALGIKISQRQVQEIDSLIDSIK